MRKEDFFEALGGSDGDIVGEDGTPMKKKLTGKAKPARLKWGAVAACLCLVCITAAHQIAFEKSTDAESGTVQELDVDYTTNDDGTYTYRDNIYRYKMEVSGMEGEEQVTFIILANDTEMSFEDISYSLKSAEISTGVPEFIILGWY